MFSRQLMSRPYADYLIRSHQNYSDAKGHKLQTERCLDLAVPNSSLGLIDRCRAIRSIWRSEDGGDSEQCPNPARDRANEEKRTRRPKSLFAACAKLGVGEVLGKCHGERDETRGEGNQELRGLLNRSECLLLEIHLFNRRDKQDRSSCDPARHWSRDTCRRFPLGSR